MAAWHGLRHSQWDVDRVDRQARTKLPDLAWAFMKSGAVVTGSDRQIVSVACHRRGGYSSHSWSVQRQ